MRHPLTALPAAFRAGRPEGITSVCSAHPLVLEAALRLARETGRPALIEATCNQVNHEGGYTGMTPADFRGGVEALAREVGLDIDRVILGGDHLGPSPWRRLPAGEAMGRAETMVRGYAEAGFTKLHLDCSMGCAGEPAALGDAQAAERAARLAAVAEAACDPAAPPVYVIGTEVPVPGGATEALDHLEVTRPGAVARTFESHREAFAARGLGAAFERVIALVVQPGVEFGHAEIVRFDPGRAADLTGCLDDLPGLVFEAHSTDYQAPSGLAALVAGGFAILKVGPWLTFALREALYGLDAITDALDGTPPQGGLMRTMDEVMRADPGHWQSHYGGDEPALWRQRHFSYSDRIRYYWPAPPARAAVAALMQRLEGRAITAPLVSQYLPQLPTRVGTAPGSAQDLLLASVQRILRIYDGAATGG